jgi:hypothetical protein
MWILDSEFRIWILDKKEKCLDVIFLVVIVFCKVKISKYNRFIIYSPKYLKLLRVLNMCFMFLDFKIQNSKLSNNLDVHMVNNKVVAANKVYKFVDVEFLFGVSTICFKFTYFDTKSFKF